MIDIKTLKFDGAGLIPAIIQDADTRTVLMMGYMNKESIAETERSGRVCFFSRSRCRLWTKGETSGNYLLMYDMTADCDGDCLLVKAHPTGPVCHTGSDTCWGERNSSAPALGDSGQQGSGFLLYLQDYLKKRQQASPAESYTARLLARGINKVAQKVGEEAVELVIEAKDDNAELFLNEAADLIYHYLVLLIAKGHSLEEVVEVLWKRHHPTTTGSQK